MREATPIAEVAILSSYEPSFLGSVPVNAHVADVDGAAQLFLESAIQFDIVDANRESFDGYKALVIPDGTRVDTTLRKKLEGFLESGGKIILSGTATLDPDTLQFGLEAVPVRYVGPAPTVPTYLRLDEILAGDSELATDYDYAFYEQAHLVEANPDAIGHGDLRQAMFNRTWEHFTSHAQAPVGESLGTPLAVWNAQVLYFAAPLFGAYREHDYWAYRAVALNVLREFLPEPALKLTGPGWVEATLHTQPAESGRPARRIIHLVGYHPRRTMQPIQHVDQSWKVSGLAFELNTGGMDLTRVYLAPDGEELSFKREGDLVSVDLPPIGAHAVVVLE